MTAAHAARHDRLLRPELPAQPVEAHRRPGQRAQEVNRRDRPLRRRDDRQRGGLHRLPRLRGARAPTRTCPTWTSAAFKQMIDEVVEGVPELQGRRHHAARGARPPRVNDWGAICLVPTASFYEATHRPGPGDPRPRRRRRQLRLRPDLRPAAESATSRTAVEYGAAHGALAMTTPGDTSMAIAEGGRGARAAAAARASSADQRQCSSDRKGGSTTSGPPKRSPRRRPWSEGCRWDSSLSSRDPHRRQHGRAQSHTSMRQDPLDWRQQAPRRQPASARRGAAALTTAIRNGERVRCGQQDQIAMGDGRGGGRHRQPAPGAA